MAWEAGRKPLGFWEGSGIPDAPPALCEFGGRDGRERYGEVGERWPNPRRILRAATGDGASASLCLFREEAVALVHSRSRAEASSTALLWPLASGCWSAGAVGLCFAVRPGKAAGHGDSRKGEGGRPRRRTAMQVASRPSGASLLLLWVSSLVSRREQATDDTVLRRKQLGLWAQTEVYSVHKFVGHFFLLLFFLSL